MKNIRKELRESFIVNHLDKVWLYIHHNVPIYYRLKVGNLVRMQTYIQLRDTIKR